ncbi:MAG: DNA-binding transcriptional regulator Fis [Gammaproteobacteria bacterium]|nr:DNA-binding transcriptional regulator Fis [Gammaproteobacteria bacterium]
MRREPVEVLSTGAQGAIDDEEPLRLCVERALRTYFEHLDGETPTDLYALVLEEMEVPLLQIVMQQVCGNQSRAAAMLGLNRGTLRKKLKQHDLL